MCQAEQESEPRQRFKATCAPRRQLSRTIYGVATVNAADAVADREYISRGTYESEADATEAARRLIEQQLLAAMAAGCAAERAFQEWTEFGEIPLIVAMGSDAAPLDFDPYSYAIAFAQRFIADAERPEVTVAQSDLATARAALAELV